MPTRGIGVDGPASDALLALGRFFSRREESTDGRATFLKGGRAGDAFYRDRWSHDKVVRSTHGVNCIGSCSWKVYVRDGIITWEAQQTDYPSGVPIGRSTSLAAARAGPPSPGTPTPPFLNAVTFGGFVAFSTYLPTTGRTSTTSI